MKNPKTAIEKDGAYLARDRYSYVSAADCSSIQDLKEKILASTKLGKTSDALDQVKGPFKQSGELLKAFGSDIGDSLEGASGTLGTILGLGATSAKFFTKLALKDATICIDDIERAKNLDPQDILHLAADLRDNENCKVVLILNENNFCKSDGSNDTEKSGAWRDSFEKGSDAHLELILDPKYAANLAFRDKDEKEIQDEKDPLVKALRPQVIKLGIENIRIIQRIWRDAKRWEKFYLENEIDVYQSLKVKIIELTAIAGNLKYCHPEELNKIGGLQSKKQKLIVKTWERMDVAYSSFRSLAEIIALNVWNGFIIQAEEVSKTLISLSLEMKERDEKLKNNKEMGEANQACDDLIKLLQEDIFSSESEPESELDNKIKQSVQNLLPKMNKIEMHIILKTVFELERFGLIKDAKEIATKWAEVLRDDKENQLIKPRQNHTSISQSYLEEQKTKSEVTPIIIQAWMDVTGHERKSDESLEFLKEEARKFIESGNYPSTEILRDLGEQQNTFWKEIFKEIGGTGCILNFWNHSSFDREENPLAPIMQNIRLYLEELSTKSPVYKKRYAEYLFTPEQKKLSDFINSFRNVPGCFLNEYVKVKKPYEAWKLSDLEAVLEKYNGAEKKTLIGNYWSACFSKTDGSTYNNILEALTLRKENQDWQDTHDLLEKLRIFQQLGILLHEYLEKFSMNSALTAYPWQELIDFKIPSDEEVKKQVEISPENTDQS
ncbi:hypothetical protein FAI41_03915 [Acetobacteraceae bacterium]|nr:hypothetical protein FAI41_03915 [Acetobacteraceae bacterium]